MKLLYYFILCMLTVGFTSFATMNLTIYSVDGSTSDQGEKAQPKRQKPTRKVSPNNSTRSFPLPNKPTATDAYSFVLAPGITATKSVSVQGGGNAVPGGQLNYSVVINNTGSVASGVTFTDVLSSDLTLVPGSVRATPVAGDDAYTAVGNIGITINAASGLLINDNSPTNIALTITAVPNGTSPHGSYTIAADGSFTYSPTAGYTGPDSFTYSLNSGSTSSVGTVAITVSGMIWFVNAAVASSGNGTLASPFKAISDITGTAAGNTIFLYTGTYTGALTLLGTQKLIGQGASASLATITGLSFTNALGTIPATGGTNPTWNSAALTLNAGNDVEGINFNSTTGTTMTGASVGALKVRDVSLTNTGGQALQITAGGALDAVFKSISASGGAKGISVNSSTGSLQVLGTGTMAGSGGTINNSSNRGIELTSVTNITLKNMNFTSANGSDGTPGTMDNSNANGAIHAQNSTGLALDNLSFTGTIAHNAINLYKVTSFSLANSTITDPGDGAGSIPSVEGGIHAIDLGGTCSITSTTIVSPSSRCILITQLGNATPLILTISNSTLRDSHDGGVQGNDNLEINCFNATVSTLNVANCTFLRSRTLQLQGLCNNSSQLTVNVQGSTFDNGSNPSGGIELSSNNTATLNFNIISNTLIKSSGQAAVYVGAKVNSTSQGRINNNTDIRSVGNCCSAIYADQDGDATMVVEIMNNALTINNAGNFDNVIFLRNANGSTNSASLNKLDAIISNNTMNMTGTQAFAGIYTTAGASGGTHHNKTCAKINGNTINGVVSPNYAHFAQESGGGASTSVIYLERVTGTGTTAEAIWNNNSNNPTGTSLNLGSSGTVLVATGTCAAPTNSNPPIVNALAVSQEQVEDNPESPVSVKTEAVSVDAKANSPVKPTDANALMAAPLSGETVTVDGAGAGFSLPPNKSTTITFSATIGSVPSSCSITNQATISGSNFATVQSNVTTTNLVVPSPTSVLPSAAVTLCSGNSVTLSASCPTGSSVQWYNAAASNTPLGTGSPLIQSPITSTTYQAACLIGGCESSRVNTAPITVFTTPSAPTNLTATPASRTSVGPVSLTASGCAGTLSWYDVSNSAVALASNNIPNLATTTTFFARCSVNSCLGPPSTTLTVSVILCTPLANSPGNVDITWTGLAGTDWNTPCNWTPAWVPDLTNALVIIPNTTNKPVITGTVPDVKAIEIGTSALLTVSGTGVLNVRGDGGTNKGIWINKGALTNASGGIINIQSSANTAVDAYIYLTTDSGTGASFTNSGTVTINSTDEAIGVGLSAIQPAQISNTATGIINIVNGIGVEMNAPTDVLNFVNAGIINYDGTELAIKLLGINTFNNTGTININSGTGIENPAGSMINNNACGKILMTTGTYSNSGTTTNLGLIQLANTYNFTNTGNFNNNGILKANSVGGVTNTRVVVTNACPMFSIGGSNDYTVDGIFTSPAATTSAGTYTLSGNRFVADNALPTGLQTLYAKFTRPSPACTVVVPFDFTNTKPTGVSVNATTICAGNSVTLTGACSAGNLIWYTSATGSASIGSGSGLVQSPTVATTYFAACETANCAGGRVATSEVTVLPIPTAPTAANVSICTGTVASLTASCGGGGSVRWYDAATGGTFLSASNPYTTTALTAQTDFYAACETAGVVCVSPSRTKVTVSINPLPVATLTSSGGSGTITCANPSLTLTATGGNSYVFAGPGVSSFNGTAGTAVINAGGIYSVTVTNTATGCSSVTSTTVSSNTAAPTLTVNPTSATLTCLVTSVTLTASGGGTSYAWTGSTTGATKVVSVSGVYSVTATAPNGCTNTTNTTVFSNTAAPTLTVNPGSGILTCTVRSLTLTASTSGTGVRWNTTETTPSIVISTSGTYSVTATASNGCLSTSSVSVINDFSAAPPTPTLSANSSVVCEGTNVQVIASGSNLSVQWYKDGSLVAGQTSATLSLGGVQVAQAGSYVLVVAGACSVSSTPFTLTLNPLPTISLLVPSNASVNGATITLPAPLTGVNFQVLGGVSFERLIVIDRINGFEIRQVDQNANGIFNVTRPGPFRLVVTGQNGCQRMVEGTIVSQ